MKEREERKVAARQAEEAHCQQRQTLDFRLRTIRFLANTCLSLQVEGVAGPHACEEHKAHQTHQSTWQQNGLHGFVLSYPACLEERWAETKARKEAREHIQHTNDKPLACQFSRSKELVGKL